MDAKIIEEAVKDYLDTHHDVQRPEGSQHIASLAVHNDIYHYLREKYGLTEFWWMMVRAVQTWFKNGEQSVAYNDVFNRLFGAAGLAGTDNPLADEFGEIWRTFIKHYKPRD